MVPFHEGFGKVLAALKLCTGFRGTDDRNGGGARVGLEGIVDAFHQWVFRTDYHHVDAVLYGKVFQTVEVVGLDGHILACLHRAGIARCDEQFLTLCALRNLPCQGVLTAAGT